jgi:DNA-binding transcriptional LysR family regulator
LRDREIDVAFVYLLPANFRELKTHKISGDRWVLALPQAHRLVKSKRVRRGDLKGEPFVWFPRTAAAPLYDRILSKCHAAGLTLNIVQEGNSLTTIMSLVAGEIGLSFTIKSAERTKPDKVVLREVEDLRLNLEFYAIWRADNKIPALRKFIEIVLRRSTEISRRR